MGEFLVSLVPVVLGVAFILSPWILHLTDLLSVAIVVTGGILLELAGLMMVATALRGLAARRR